MKSKRKTDVEIGKENRKWVIDLINKQGRDLIECNFLRDNKESGLAIQCQLYDNPDKKIILEIRLSKNIKSPASTTTFPCTGDNTSSLSPLKCLFCAAIIYFKSSL